MTIHLPCPPTLRDGVGHSSCIRHVSRMLRCAIHHQQTNTPLHTHAVPDGGAHRHQLRQSGIITSSSIDAATTCNNTITTDLPFDTEFVLPAGRVVMRIMQHEDEKGAAVVLTRSFATQPGGLPIQDVSQYVQEMRDAPPHGVLLVARLFPDDQDARTRVIATASLSLTADTRERFSTLQPPDSQALLANIAVDPKFRRQGVASRLLAACEALTKDVGLQELYLHVRLADDAARALYAVQGYTQVDKDTMFVSLRGRMPRALMVKQVN